MNALMTSWLAALVSIALALGAAAPALAGAPPTPESYFKRVPGYEFVALTAQAEAQLGRQIEQDFGAMRQAHAARLVTRDPARMVLIVIAVDPAELGPGTLDAAVEAFRTQGLQASTIEVAGREAVLAEGSQAVLLTWLHRNFVILLICKDANMMRSFAAGLIQANEDRIAPTTSVTLSPDAAASGWHQGTVSVRLGAADNPDGAGIRDVTYRSSGAEGQQGSFETDGSITLSTEGQTTLTVFAEDWDGNVEPEQQVTIRIDRTPPTVTFTGGRATYALYEPVSVSCTVQDDLSGVATRSCEQANARAVSFGLGEHTLTATATDEAGNTRTESVTYSVVLTPEVIGVPFVAVALIVGGLIWLRRRQPKTLPTTEPALPI